MGQKDLPEKNLESFPDVFADIVNVLLYEGTEMVTAENLRPAPTETFYYSQLGKMRNQFHDVSMFEQKNEVIRVQYTLENETKVSRKIIFRRIGYEGAVYREQLEKKVNYPFVGLVLYWGRKKCRQPRSVAEFFVHKNLPLETWKYINNFHLQIFEMARLPKEVRRRFTSDMRLVVDYLAEGDNYKPSGQAIIHLEAFLLMMKHLSGDKRYEQLIQELSQEESKGEKITMCKLIDKYIDQGQAQMLVQNVETLMKSLSFNLQQACESLGFSVTEYQKAKKRKCPE